MVTLAVVFIAALASVSCGQSPAEYLRRGDELVKQNQLEDAVLNYRKALQKEPRNAEAHYRIGQVRLAQREGYIAHEAFRTAHSIEPGNVRYRHDLMRVALQLYMEIPARPQDLYTELNTHADWLLEKDPRSFEAWRVKGYLAFLNSNIPEAVQAFTRAGETRPLDPDVTTALVQCLLVDQREAQAIELAQQLIAKEPGHIPVYDTLYVHYQQTRRAPLAGQVLEQKMRNHPGSVLFALQFLEHAGQSGKPVAADALLERFFAEPAKHPDALLEAGDYHAQRRQWARARDYYERGLAAHPAAVGVYQSRLAAALSALGQLDQAIGAANRAVASNPQDAAARAQRGSLFLATGDPRQLPAALADFQHAVRLAPKQVSYHLDLGRALEASRKPDEAAIQYREALKLDPFHPETNLHLAEMAVRQFRFTEVLAHLGPVLNSRSVATPRARLLFAVAQLGVGNLAGARGEMTDLARERPADREVQLQLGLIALAEGDTRQAEAIFSRLPPAQADLRAVRGLVQTYQAKGETAKAVRLLEDTEARLPRQGDLRLELADLAAGIGQIGIAMRTLEAVVANDASPHSSLRLGQLYLAAHRPGDALPPLRRAAAADPPRAEALDALAVALQQTGNPGEARALHQRAIELAPNDAGLLNNFAFFLAETGTDLDKALELAQRAVRQNPEQVSFIDTLGWVYWKQGKTDSALQTFRAVVQRDPKTPEYRYHLGLALLRTGDRAGARQEFSAALELSPSPLLRAEISKATGSAEP